MRSSVILYSLMILLFATPTADSAVYEAAPNVFVVGWERLAALQQQQLRQTLFAIPRVWHPALRVITVDDAPIPDPFASEQCARFPGQGPCRINIFSTAGPLSNEFPPDEPGAAVPQFVSVLLHELSHQLDVVAWFDSRGLFPSWRTRLLADAGCEPSRYLRSMLPRCYFRDFPQEFLASAFTQWLICSRCTLRLALTRWEADIPHPLQQLVFLLAVAGFHPALLENTEQGTILAYRTGINGLPVPELWTISPWRCGEINTMQGSAFVLLLRTDELCNVTDILDRHGL